MCWQCDHPGATTADYLKILRASILKQGWAVQYVEDDRNPFAYTIGLHERGLAELLVTGVSPQRASQLLNTVARYTVREVQPAPGDLISLPEGQMLEVVQVEQPDAHLNMAVAIYGRKVRALQLVWRDERGHSPWCPDFDEGRGSQPVLGKRAVQNA
jgi:hypothetical protein